MAHLCAAVVPTLCPTMYKIIYDVGFFGTLGGRRKAYGYSGGGGTDDVEGGEDGGSPYEETRKLFVQLRVLRHELAVAGWSPPSHLAPGQSVAVIIVPQRRRPVPFLRLLPANAAATASAPRLRPRRDATIAQVRVSRLELAISSFFSFLFFNYLRSHKEFFPNLHSRVSRIELIIFPETDLPR